ncbi:hypothetical protein IQ254_25375 [Nodosilinea sp. LEGE 07088]|uniref:hypothetical protein n=1 Tax=Nodosilinea sp. LEGE 07088 TaxID=2777968 RepID=UPI0018821571|nr:hypothetical protein [Nodosilinea sp. LEGE 07088]MBE9140491.1 hypothetical protein [Nodosilinea sp. LEGE 07088]
MTGFEPLIGAAAAGLGGLITSLVKDKGTETLKKIDWDIGKNVALRKAMEADFLTPCFDQAQGSGKDFGTQIRTTATWSF